MRIKTFKLLILFLLIIFITGCWDRMELEERAILAVIGIDKAENQMLEITYVIANPKAATPGEGEAQAEAEVFSFLIPDLSSAKDIVNASVSRRISYSHVESIIVGEELAKDERFFNFFAPVLRDKELRRNISFFVSRESASEFIENNKPVLEERPHTFYQHMRRRWHQTGISPDSTVHSFVKRTEEDAGLFLVSYATATIEDPKAAQTEDDFLPGEFRKIGGNPTQIVGSAVFKDGQMIGELTGEETRLTLLLRADVQTDPILVTYPDPINQDFLVSGMIRKYANAKVKMNLDGDFPIIDITVPLAFDITGIPSLVDYVQNKDNLELLKKSIRSSIIKKADELVLRTQREFKGDPFQWSHNVRKQFLTLEEFKEYDWMSQYPEAVVNIDIDLVISAFGRQLDPIDIEKIKD
ncbi:Ger(x)C family spore germination protein [Serpentinicella sp. ANB-PHB4]|uniref:Ger(x)C family spore germination protein n=1 Tax=Serpentinicella sp. ANB-PHB4 TaxID=3074076 RepID=UPI00285531DB|nr:Ger(x)C family spore germination protein [Serpentinicella sp. ANB-PHB4]MDR5658355.1 Ger(x)C family spore germination protein [Serpentinicella sp. ANB-PHB4]